MKRETPFATEAELCAAFIAVVDKDWTAGGSHGRLWACETHRDDIRDRAAATLTPAAQGPPVQEAQQQQRV